MFVCMVLCMFFACYLSVGGVLIFCPLSVWLSRFVLGEVDCVLRTVVYRAMASVVRHYVIIRSVCLYRVDLQYIICCGLWLVIVVLWIVSRSRSMCQGSSLFLARYDIALCRMTEGRES